MTDRPTLAFYSAEAAAYAASTGSTSNRDLDDFLALLSRSARILELGCGSGSDAATMMQRGFDVVATDGCPELAREAACLIGKPVRVLLFEELDVESEFDAVWANASLLHVPRSNLSEVLRRIWRALRPGGLFYASYKAGQQDGRDRFDRYYNYPSKADLVAFYSEAATWEQLYIVEQRGSGYDNQPTDWLAVTARRPPH